MSESRSLFSHPGERGVFNGFKTDFDANDRDAGGIEAIKAVVIRAVAIKAAVISAVLSSSCSNGPPFHFLQNRLFTPVSRVQSRYLSGGAMSMDLPFYRLATEFPDAIPWLLGIHTHTHYRTLSVSLKKEHRLDAVLIPDDPTEPRLLVEFQGYRDGDILRRIVASGALYCEKERYPGCLHLAVVFLEQAHARMLEPVIFRLAGGQVVALEPQILVLGPDIAEQILSSGRAEVVPLLPLCIRSEAQIRAESAGWREQIDIAPLPHSQKEALIGLLGAFVLHRLGNISLKALNALLGGFMMENTQVGQELMELGRLKGYHQGQAEGIEMGLEKGLLIARSNVLQVLTRRFKRSSQRATHLVERLGSLETASSALTAALDAESIEALEEVLSGLVEE